MVCRVCVKCFRHLGEIEALLSGIGSDDLHDDDLDEALRELVACAEVALARFGEIDPEYVRSHADGQRLRRAVEIARATYKRPSVGRPAH